MIREARRTVALRPGATGLTPPSSQAASNPCLNCGTNIQLNFCPECGQRALDPDPTLRELLHELAEHLLHWDGKLLTTFRLLCTRPGALTQEYLAGRRASFISPLRVYLTCSVLFFFVRALVPESPSTARTSAATDGRGVARRASSQIGPVTVTETDGSSVKSWMDSLARSENLVARTWGVHFGKALGRQAEFQASMRNAGPKMMFVLVPLFAALATVVFRDRRMRYPQHLAFALHVHAFLFLALILTLTSRVISSTPLGVATAIASVAAIALYLVQSVRGVYGLRLGQAIVRSTLLSVAYFALFVVAMLVTFVGVVLLF